MVTNTPTSDSLIDDFCVIEQDDETTRGVRCEGIQHPKLQNAVDNKIVDAGYLMKHWNVWCGRIVAMNCENYVDVVHGSNQCASCRDEFRNVTKNHSKLFQVDAASRSVVEHQYIADSNVIIKSIKGKWESSTSQHQFENDPEVANLSRLLLFKGDTQPIQLSDDMSTSERIVMYLCLYGNVPLHQGTFDGQYVAGESCLFFRLKSYKQDEVENSSPLCCEGCCTRKTNAGIRKRRNESTSLKWSSFRR